MENSPNKFIQKRFLIIRLLLAWMLIWAPTQSLFACVGDSGPIAGHFHNQLPNLVDHHAATNSHDDANDAHSLLHGKAHDNSHCQSKMHCYGEHCGQSALTSTRTIVSSLARTTYLPLTIQDAFQLVVSQDLRPPII